MLDAYRAEYKPATPTNEFLVRQFAMADWRLLRLHRIEAAFYSLRHKELDDTRSEDLAHDDDARLAWIAWMDATSRKSVLASFHRYEIRLERSAKNARQELDRRPVALVCTPPVERPEAQPSPKIISIETVERAPAPNQQPTSNIQHPSFGAPPAVDPAPTTEK